MASPNANTTEVLLILPPEIRNMIYEMSCPPKYYHITNLYPHPSWEPPFVAAASVNIRNETAPIHYNKNRISADIDTDKQTRDISPRYASWTNDVLRNIYELYGSKTLNNLDIPFQMQRREGSINMRDLLPLLELIRTSGLHLSSRGASLYLGSVHQHVRNDLNEAIAIGERAYESGCDGRTLGSRFRTWKRKKIRMQKQGVERRKEEVDRFKERAHDEERNPRKHAGFGFGAGPRLDLYSERWVHGQGEVEEGSEVQLVTGVWYYNARRVFPGTIPRWRYIWCIKAVL